MDTRRFPKKAPPIRHVPKVDFTEVRGRLILLGKIDDAFAQEVTRRKREWVAAEGAKEKHGAGEYEESEQCNLNGDASELAFSRWIGCAWRPTIGKQERTKFDVADYHCRSSLGNDGPLIIRPPRTDDEVGGYYVGDADGKWVHLLTLRPYDAYWVTGWLWRNEVREAWLTNFKKPARPMVYGIWPRFLNAAVVPTWEDKSDLEHYKSDPWQGEGPPPPFPGQDRAGL